MPSIAQGEGTDSTGLPDASEAWIAPGLAGYASTWSVKMESGCRQNTEFVEPRMAPPPRLGRSDWGS
jgi:hypothetical protein